MWRGNAGAVVNARFTEIFHIGSKQGAVFDGAPTLRTGVATRLKINEASRQSARPD
jgi:hypothetical protein